MKKNILFYTSFNTRSRDTESLMEAFLSQGHQVYLLTQADYGDYHESCEKLGVKCFAYSIKKNNPISFFLKHSSFLISFIHRKKIDIVFSHLENASLPAVLIQPFTQCKVVTCRHIIDEAFLLKSKKFILQNKIVYTFSKNIIVVSNRAKDFMIKKEGIKSKKIEVIPLSYNFNLYPSPNMDKVFEIKNEFKTSMLILTASRLVKPKRVVLSIKTVQRLVEKGEDVKLLILGRGPQFEFLERYITTHNLQKNVFLLGYVSNILDYLLAMDILIHPSILDASAVIIKEAGLMKKPIIACSEIGDLDEYIVNYHSGLLVNKSNFEEETTKALDKILKDKTVIEKWGKNLYNLVIERFSIAHNLKLYMKYLK